MPRLIRIILITILTASLALLYPNNISSLYGLALVGVTAFLTPSISQRFANYLRVMLQILTLVLFSVFALMTLSGVHHGIARADLMIFSFTVGLVWVLLHTAEMTFHLFWELATLVITLVAALLWLFLQGTPTTPPVVGATPAEQQFNRIVQAIGGNNPEQTQQELTTRFGAHDSDTWKNGLGSTITTTGPWSLRLFFPEFSDSGNSLAQGLWDRRLDELQIADAVASLQPLLHCRVAIRNLFLNNTEKYIPFFQSEDFGSSSTQFRALEDKVYLWSSNAINQGAIKAQRGCDTKPDPTETIIVWIGACLKPIEGGFTGDKDLQRIKAFGDACGAVTFM